MVNRQINRRDKDAHRGGFDYRPSDPKKLKERAERRGGGFDTFLNGFNMFRPKNGENAMRICPPTWKGHEHFGLEIWVHGYIGVDRSSYLCPKKMLGKKCPICDFAAEALADGEKEDSDKIKAKMKVLYWIIDRDGDSDDPQPWAVSGQFDQDISGRCNKRNGKVLEIDNPWEGHDVTFRRTGQRLNTRYLNVDIDPDKTALHQREKDTERVLDFLKENPLDGLLKYYSFDHLAAAIEGKGSKEKDEDDEIDDDDGDRKQKRRPSRDADEDEDEGDRGDRKRTPRRRNDDDEEEDERPARRKSRDDDEDEEEKTSRKRSSRDDDEGGDKDRRSSRRSNDEDEDDRGGGRRRRQADDDEDEDGSSRKRNKRERSDDEDEDRPRGKRSRADEDEGDDESPPSSRRAKRNRDEDDD